MHHHTAQIINAVGLTINSAALDKTTAPDWFGDIFKSLVAPAVVAVMFTGLTSYCLERLKGRREAITNLTTTLRDDLRRLQELGADYWSRGAHPDDATREAFIMSLLAAISTGLRSLHAETKIIVANDLGAWLIQLQDHLTGGGFQTSTRTADFARIQIAAGYIAKMQYGIFNARLRKL